MKSLTQEMRFRKSPMKYCEKYGVKRTARKRSRVHNPFYSRIKRQAYAVPDNRCEARNPAQAHSPVYSAPQRQG